LSTKQLCEPVLHRSRLHTWPD